MPVFTGSDTLDDSLLGSALNDTLNGFGGDDTLNGGAGNDSINAGNDKDLLLGNAGADTLLGGDGDDVLHGFLGTGGEDPDALDLADELRAGSGNDILRGNSGNDRLFGDGGDDDLRGDAGSDTLDGGAGLDMAGYRFDEVSLGTGVVFDASDVGTAGTVVLGDGRGGVDTLISIERVSLEGSRFNDTLIGSQGNDRINGNLGNDSLDGGLGIDTLNGGAGNDTYTVDQLGDVVTESGNLSTEIDRVRAGISWTLGANLENLTLTGSDAINGTGNSRDNALTGNNAANTLNGGAGADTLTGSGGNDTYTVENVGDVVVETSAQAGQIDRVNASVSYTLGANVEDLTLTGTAAIDGTGNTLSNSLRGNAANNSLNGGVGADTLNGGLGDDTYTVDNVGDVIVESSTLVSDVDTVNASITWTLDSNLEHLTLTGTRAINGFGNSLANILTGNSGANTLNGAAGADTMIGGLGNDTYTVDNAGDVITETSAAETEVDRVNASISWTLAANLENLTLTENGAINATGNTRDNVLAGNAAANTLNGGAGADSLNGGAGNDTYVVENLGDVVTETSASATEIDRVNASVSWTLGANLEDLTLTGSAAVNGTGNTLDNTLRGNGAANSLNGGLGADTMNGGAGNDTYGVENVGDVVTESGTALTEIDRVNSSISYVLGNNLENLTLTGGGAINGTGNSRANTIAGNSASNTLNGGTGPDTLTGGAGADIFLLSSENTSDLITDFKSNADDLRISQSGIRIGDGDLVVDGARNVGGPGGFATTAELVVISRNIDGLITTANAAAAIGTATSAYAVGDTRLFAVDNGSSTALYLFTAANANALVSAAELQLLATLEGTPSITTTDILFGG